MLADHFQVKSEELNGDLCLLYSPPTSSATSTHQTMPTSASCFEAHHQVTVASGAEEISHHSHQQHQQQQQLLSSVAPTSSPSSSSHMTTSGYPSGPALRYYPPPPLMDHYHHHHGPTGPLNPYSSLNQKRESVITFSSNHPHAHPHATVAHAAALKNAYLESLDLEEEKTGSASRHNGCSLSPKSLQYSSSSSSKYKQANSQLIAINNITFTIEQVVCICQVLQKSDLHKLEKFIYNLPDDSKLSKNELILRARAVASFHAGNYKEVYDILERTPFSMKYHQELQNLWNNSHYKEHELKRGHPPGAVEKYRIRKKYQFPRTIWDGEEYVYCFKEKNRKMLKEFYLKCNLPTQEDKLKLSSQTQLTVVQISNWFKNRRQRDRQPNHEHDNRVSSDAHSNLTTDSSPGVTPSPPLSSMSSLNSAVTSPPFSVPDSLALSAITQQTSAVAAVSAHHHAHLGSLGTAEDPFCHSQPPAAHRSYYFLPQ